MYDLHHPLDLLGRDRSGATLFPQQVHYVGGELIAGLKRITKTTVRISLCAPRWKRAEHRKDDIYLRDAIN